MKKLINQWVYKNSTKPKHCVEVRNPPKTALEKLLRPQDARQMQYNRWSKRFKIYSGSYLPADHRELLKKGWVRKKISSSTNSFYQRKSTNQTIRYDEAQFKKGRFEKGHYHWYIWWKNYFGKTIEERFKKTQYNNKRRKKVYYNEFGEKTCFANFDHHIFR